MYLSQQLVENAFKGLRHIGPDEGKTRQERVSGLAYLLATSRLLVEIEQQEVSLAPESDYRTRFIQYFGDVVRVRGPCTYTYDFLHTTAKSDYSVGSNFLTTALAQSRHATRTYPGRPAPLLKLVNDGVSILDDFEHTLVHKFKLDSYKGHLAIWLLRFRPFNPVDGDRLSHAEVSSNLLVMYGAVGKALTPSQEELDTIVESLGRSIYSDEAADTSSFGLQNSDNEKTNGEELEEGIKVERPVVGENLIIYGAPGTGKSYFIDQKIKDAAAVSVRTVFHPDYQYSDFIGGVKPCRNGDDISYDFSPGPFMEAIKKAINHTSKPVFLIVEELNRASASAVFGDTFLLLDRDMTGESEYDIDFPSLDCRKWLQRETNSDIERLYIPRNLTLLATMNSADQGVQHLDTAFRRRWKQKYLPLVSKAHTPDRVLEYISDMHDVRLVLWTKFTMALNNMLMRHDIPEDRLIGPWFVKQDELNESMQVPEKVLHYLWDDVLRHQGRNLVFASGYLTYGQLYEAYNEKRQIFSDSLIASLNSFAL